MNWEEKYTAIQGRLAALLNEPGDQKLENRIPSDRRCNYSKLYPETPVIH